METGINQDFFTQYQTQLEAHYNLIRADYDAVVEKAREKWWAHQKFHNDLFEGKLIYTINTRGWYDKEYQAMRNEFKFDNTMELSEIVNNTLNSIQGDKAQALKSFAITDGLNKFLDYWRERDKILKTDSDSIASAIKIPDKPNITWKGTKTEFMQLIYSLFHSGYINNEEGEITKLVNDMATVWNIELGKNWQSDISKNLTLRNNDYRFEIFDKMKEGLEKHQQERLSKKK